MGRTKHHAESQDTIAGGKSRVKKWGVHNLNRSTSERINNKTNDRLFSPIFNGELECYKCYKKTKIQYPGINYCQHCNAYQGDWYVWHEYLEHIYDDDFMNKITWSNKPICCSECGNEIEYKPEMTRELIDKIFGGGFTHCHLCNLEYELEQLLEENPIYCKGCNCLIIQHTENDIPLFFILNSENVVYSNAIRHHINYIIDKTVIVCEKCHGKIHHSKKPEDLEWLKPIGKRKNLCIR